MHVCMPIAKVLYFQLDLIRVSVMFEIKRKQKKFVCLCVFDQNLVGRRFYLDASNEIHSQTEKCSV